MELREREGEEVLVLKPYSDDSPYKVGDIGKARGEYSSEGHCLIKAGGYSRACVARKSLLAIGDKVTRGPDMHKDCNCPTSEGTDKVGVVVEFREGSNRNVVIQWDGLPHQNHYRMNPDHQDLKPVGDSVDEGAPKCFGDNKCPGDCKTCNKAVKNTNGGHIGCKCFLNKGCKLDNKCKDYKEKPIKEPNTGRIYTDKPTFKDQEKPMSETFNRLERAKEIEMTLLPKAKNSTKSAQEKEVLLKEEMDRLTTFPTEYAEKEFLLHKLVGIEKAKETMRCIELGLPVTVNIVEKK